MSSFDPNQAYAIDTSTLSYKYPNGVTINKNNISPINANIGSKNYYKINYNYPAPSNIADYPFIFSNVDPPQYLLENVYFFGLLHGSVPGSENFVGEVVLEHKNISESNKKLYSCFFIQKEDTHTDNIIDKLRDNIENSATIPSSPLNTVIPDAVNGSKYYYYYDTINPANLVFIFLNPIKVSKASANWFSQRSTDSTLLFAVENEIYIDCNPAGVSNETISTYNLPINSELMDSKQQMDFMKTSVNFFIFIIGTLLAYFGMPLLYKKVVIDSVEKLANIDEKKLPESGVLTRIRSMDIFISLIVFIGIIFCFVTGFTKDDFKSLSTGLFLLVLFALSVAIIQSKKSNGSFDTERIKYKDGKSIETDFNDILQVATMNAIYFIIVKMGKIYLAVLTVVALVIFAINESMKVPIKKTGDSILVAAIVLIPIVAAIKLML
jgi:hypothetical protein